MERGKQNVTLLTLWHTAQAVGVKSADLLDEGVVIASAAADPDGSAAS
jgi:hypothetical protein